MTRRRRNLLDQILVESASCICIVDSKRRIRFFSPGMEAWTGWEASQVEGLTCDGVLSSDPSPTELLASALAPSEASWQGQAQFWNAVLASAKGGVVRSRMCSIPIAGDSVQIERVFIVRTDCLKTVDGPLPESLGQRLHAEVAALRTDSRRRGGWDSFVGTSSVLTEVRQLAELLRHSTCNFSVTGPSGSGRRHLARCIHAGGRSAEYSFVPVHCDLLSAEDLYGTICQLHRRRSESATAHERTGLLLLVDVDRLPREVQQWLFDRQADESDIRLAGTSVVCLQEVVRAGWMLPKFRKLLSPVEICIPALHSRGEDVLLLAHEFVQQNCRLQQTPAHEIDEQVARLFLSYRWPGNVRELQQVIFDVCRACPGRVVTEEHLPFSFRAGMEAQAVTPETSRPFQSLDELLRTVEKEIIASTLAACGSNKAEAARRLGLTRPSLYRRLRSAGLEAEEGP